MESLAYPRLSGLLIVNAAHNQGDIETALNAAAVPFAWRESREGVGKALANDSACHILVWHLSSCNGCSDFREAENIASTFEAFGCLPRWRIGISGGYEFREAAKQAMIERDGQRLPCFQLVKPWGMFSPLESNFVDAIVACVQEIDVLPITQFCNQERPSFVELARAVGDPSIGHDTCALLSQKIDQVAAALECLKSMEKAVADHLRRALADGKNILSKSIHGEDIDPESRAAVRDLLKEALAVLNRPATDLATE